MYAVTIIFVVIFAAVFGATNEDVRQLRNDLLLNYSSNIRPVRNQSDSIAVDVSYELEMVLDLDEKRQILSTNGWFNFQFRDELLQWNASDYGGLQDLWLTQSELWLPDITISNRADTYAPLGNPDYLVPVESNGDVAWSPQVHFDTRCDVDITMFPFDTQQCTLVVTTIAFTMREVHIAPMANVSISKSPSFLENGGWEVISTHSLAGKQIYECCNYSDITLFIDLRRRQSFYVFNTIIPVVMLSALSTAVFTLTPESSEKMTLSITVLLAIGVFLTMITEITPKASQTTSLMAMYLVILLAVSVAAIFLSSLSLSLFHRHPKKIIHPWLKRIVSRVNGQGQRNRKLGPIKIQPDAHALKTMKHDPVYEKEFSNDDCTWHEVVTAMDRIFFWMFFGFTVVVTTVVLSVMLTASTQ